MSALRLYEVEVTVRVMVLAASKADAESFAERDDGGCISDSLRMDASAHAHEPKRLDADLADTLPWHSEDVSDRTCAEWLAEIQAADAEAKRVAEFAARQVPLPLG